MPGGRAPATWSAWRPATWCRPTPGCSTARDLHVQRGGADRRVAAGREGGGAGRRRRRPPDDRDLVFLGTSVVSGTATAVVIATGPATAFGDMAARLAARPPETEFERGTRRFGLFIMQTVVFLVLFVFLVNAAAAARPAGVAALRGRAGGRADARVPADDHRRHARPRRGADGAAEGDRQAPGGDPELRQHGRPLQRQDRHAHRAARWRSTATSTRAASRRRAAVRARRASTAPSRPGIKSPLDAAILRHERPAESRRYRKVDEIPFDFERRRLSVVVEDGGRRGC